ncbi:uncharacterized protein N7482_007814 [Penicillium canariense]|uniref:Uncharacterized protein n=1 Tax=Penicillium canariense TaxID=189055 RepID=A0A9W9I2F1_9EURO|nr:uncharacterized protein N7482_007814 [Penicillium canariense]KAJ5160810.1 hypothetical protein N7482_007814 [Penicillium canariense]
MKGLKGLIKSKPESTGNNQTEYPPGSEGWKLAQKERSDQYFNHTTSKKWDTIYKWGQSIIEVNIQLAETVRREQSVKEEIRRLMMSFEPEDKKQVQTLNDNLADLNRKYGYLSTEHPLGI